MKNKIKMVKQPEGSSICGHCCVAMITGEPIERVIEMFGHTHSTRTKEVHKVLLKLGYRTDTRLTRFTNTSGLPDFGIVKITYDWRKNYGHWAVIKNVGNADFRIYCPSGDVSSWLTYSNGKGRITSFLKVY